MLPLGFIVQGKAHIIACCSRVGGIPSLKIRLFNCVLICSSGITPVGRAGIPAGPNPLIIPFGKRKRVGPRRSSVPLCSHATAAVKEGLEAVRVATLADVVDRIGQVHVELIVHHRLRVVLRVALVAEAGELAEVGDAHVLHALLLVLDDRGADAQGGREREPRRCFPAPAFPWDIFYGLGSGALDVHRGGHCLTEAAGGAGEATGGDRARKRRGRGPGAVFGERLPHAL